MRAKKLSPLDLGDVFAFGDAGVHGKVPLRHVCEVLFDLDLDGAGGSNPISESMEEFLYEHSFDDKGEIVVDIKEALRSLDIWQLDNAPPSLPATTVTANHTKSAHNSRARAILLESKSKKLEEVVATIRRDNARLIQELEASKGPRVVSEDSPRMRTSQSQLQFSDQRQSPSLLPTRQSAAPSQGESGMEEELATIANELAYSGVKALEQQLVQIDTAATGFVSLKQLRWLLADHFAVEVSETRLLEMCLGMNFNSQAQLEYKELVTALLDILIYTAPVLAASKRNDALSRFEKFLASGFPPDRLQVRRMVEMLCRKYDVEGDGRIALAELLRVLRCDLVEDHALHLEFPLTEKETIQLVLSTSVRPVDTSGDTPEAFVYYDEVLDALFGGIYADEALDEEQGAQLKQALSGRFWERIRKTLCNGSRAKEASVLDQIVKIVGKLDRGKTFTMSPLFFKRIFDRHLRQEDIYVLSRVLHVPGNTGDKDRRDRSTLRYDVFLFMTFGAPPIDHDMQSKYPFTAELRLKLTRNERSLRMGIAGMMKTRGADWRLDLKAFCELVASSTEQEPLVAVELLFLYAALSTPSESVHQVQLKALWTFLLRDCWDQPDSSRLLQLEESSTRPQVSSSSLGADSVEKRHGSVRELIVECLNNYNLERVLAPYKHKHQGWITISKLVAELARMVREVGVSDRYKSEKELIRELEVFLSRIAARADKAEIQNSRDAAPFPGAISLHDFFESVFDWTSIAQALQLPRDLAEINKQLQTFDWEKNGTILCDDWNKAWRQMCLGQSGMREWEIRVLQRRFPGSSASPISLEKASVVSTSGRMSSLWSESINYSRLLMFLIDQHQQRARDQLYRHTIDALRREATSTAGSMSTFRLEKLFRSLDRDDKGYFNARDLTEFLSNDSVTNKASEVATEECGNKDEDILKLLENSDAVGFVMKSLSSGVPLDSVNQAKRVARDSDGQSKHKPAVVTLDQFRRLVSGLASRSRGNPVRKPRHSLDIELQRSRGGPTVIASLHLLELTLLEIARDVSNAKGHIVPLRAFRHFSQGSAEQHTQYGGGQPTSPLRSPRRDELSSPIKNRQRELYAAPTDPLAPEKLKQVLQRCHRLTVSTHLISQFFIHIGAASKHFLELSEFSRWAAPLAVEMQNKVRETVRKMIVKGKGGGGKVDLDRFLAQLERRLLDSPVYSSRLDASIASSMGGSRRPLPPRVPLSLLLSKLHQLNIPLRKPDATALLRHFGMEDEDEYVDYTLFLQRLYETSLAGQA